MKNVFSLFLMIVTAGSAYGSSCKEPHRSYLRQAVYDSSITAKALRTKVPRDSSYFSITEAREVCFLEGQLYFGLQDANRFADELNPSTRSHLALSLADETKLGPLCRTSTSQSVQNLPPRSYYETVDRIATEMDFILVDH